MPMFSEAAKYAAYQMKKHAGQILKNPLTGAIKAVDGVAQGVIDGIVEPYAEAAATATIKGAKLTGNAFTKKVDPSLKNFYTGREMRKGSGWALSAGAVGVGYAAYAVSTTAPKPGTVSYGGTAPIMDADGVSNTTNAPTLNASGNMVFGLHNARKG
jgi:hypothetical protein